MYTKLLADTLPNRIIRCQSQFVHTRKTAKPAYGFVQECVDFAVTKTTVYRNIIHRELLFVILKFLYRWWWFICVWVCGDVCRIGSVLYAISPILPGDTCTYMHNKSSKHVVVTSIRTRPRVHTWNDIYYTNRLWFGLPSLPLLNQLPVTHSPHVIKAYPNSFWMAFWCTKRSKFYEFFQEFNSRNSSAILVVQYTCDYATNMVCK